MDVGGDLVLGVRRRNQCGGEQPKSEPDEPGSDRVAFGEVGDGAGGVFDVLGDAAGVVCARAVVDAAIAVRARTSAMQPRRGLSDSQPRRRAGASLPDRHALTLTGFSAGAQ